VVAGEPNEKKENINGGESDNTGGNKNDNIKGGIKKGTGEGINKGFKKKDLLYHFFRAFTTPTVFAAFIRRNLTD